MKNTVLKYGIWGLIIGLVIFGTHLLMHDFFEYSTNTIIGYVSIVLSLSIVYFGIKHYRDEINNGTISIGRAILIGVLISILVGVGIGIADFIYTKFVNPDFFNDYAQNLKDQGREDEIWEITSETAALFMLGIVTVIGFIVSLISSLILQRKN